MGEDEAGFIALHMVNARIDGNEMKSTLKMTEIVQHILNIITYHYGIVLDESSFSYSRFLTHLQYFAMRVIRKEVIHSGEEFFVQPGEADVYRSFCLCPKDQ